MPTGFLRHNRGRPVIIMVAALLLLLGGWRPVRDRIQGLETHTAVDTPQYLSDLWTGRIPRQYLSLRNMLTPGGPAFEVGTNRMEWSDGGKGAGYFYACLPRSNQRYWEFAPCSRTQLPDVQPEDALRKFHPHGWEGIETFGEDWRTNALRVHDGQIILARPVAQPRTLYALKIVQQKGGIARIQSRQLQLPPPGR